MTASALAPRAVRGFNCPSCGAAVVLRGLAWTQTVACASCGAVLDARDPNLRILQEAARRQTVRPLIPLGTRGQWHGAPYDVIGLQQRTIHVGGEDYAWREYLLFNPYQGFRYLTEYDGHWNDVVPLNAVPTDTKYLGKPAVEYDGARFRHFQSASARTTYVVGEFPWEVRVGDAAYTRDYTAPPRLLSAESTSAESGADETTWSLGRYVDGEAIWRAFGLEGRPPRPRGIYVNQPSPFATGAASIWGTFLLLAAALVVTFLGREITARHARAFEQRYVFDPAAVRADANAGASGSFGDAPNGAPNASANAASAAFVTPSFTLDGADANVVVETEADVDNGWLGVDYTLVDETTGRAVDFDREVSYYHGVDSDGSWSEGSHSGSTRLGAVPGGRYFLRVEPSGETEHGRVIGYTVRVRRDVPAGFPYLAAFFLLLLPPVWDALRRSGFENRRWAESDYAPSSSDD